MLSTSRVLGQMYSTNNRYRGCRGYIRTPRPTEGLGDNGSEGGVRRHGVLCKRFWQQPYLAKVQKDRFPVLVDAKAFGVHVRLHED